MFRLLKRQVANHALVAICTSSAGLALARIRREPGLPPVLDLGEFHATPAGEQQALLSKLSRQHHLDSFVCHSVMGLGQYNLLLVEAPDVQPAELRAAIRWRIKDLIDFHVDDAVIDVFEVPNQKTAGRNSMMYAVVARADIVRQRIERMTDANINLVVVDIPELALRNLAALLPEDVGGVATLYLEAHSGLITITRQGVLYLSRQIDLGYLDVFSNPDSGELSHDQIDRIVVEIQRSLDYYESHFSQPAVSSVVVMPAIKPVNGMADYLNSQLDLKVRDLDLNQLVDAPVALDPATQGGCLLAIGAALREEGKAL